MSSDPGCLGGINFYFAGIQDRWDENLSYEHTQVCQPGKVGYIFLQCTCIYFALEFFPDSIGK